MPVRSNASPHSVAARDALPQLTWIVNRAARGAGAAAWRRVADQLRASGLASDPYFPAHPDETARLVHRVADGDSAVVAAGGDGTVNTIVNALAGRDVALAIVPLGTANDLAHALGIPLDPVAAARRLLVARERRIDVVEMHGRRFCTVGGFGLPAVCARAVNRARHATPWGRPALGLLGTHVYPALALLGILRTPARAPRLRITYREPSGATRRLALRAHGVFVANQSTLAAGLTLPTESDHADGVFELCIIRPVPRLRLLAALHCLQRGRPVPHGVFEVRAATQAHVVCAVAQPLFGDGESFGHARRFAVRVRRQALRVLA